MSRAELPAAARALIDAPEPAVLATLNRDGTQHLCVMWVARDGDELLMSTKEHRRQYANLHERPRASVLVYERAHPLRYVAIAGRALLGGRTRTGETAQELIARLNREYLGEDADPWPPEDVRTLIRIVPDRVNLHDG